MAGAYAKIEGHEELCAERYRNIADDISELKDLSKLVRNGVITLLVGLAGWSLVQLYDGLKHPTPSAPVAAIATVTKP